MWARHGDWKHTLSAAVHYHCEHGDVNEKKCWSYLQYLFSTLGGKHRMLICIRSMWRSRTFRPRPHGTWIAWIRKMFLSDLPSVHTNRGLGPWIRNFLNLVSRVDTFQHDRGSVLVWTPDRHIFWQNGVIAPRESFLLMSCYSPKCCPGHSLTFHQMEVWGQRGRRSIFFYLRSGTIEDSVYY